MSEEMDKLKLIEEDLKQKSVEIDTKEKESNDRILAKEKELLDREQKITSQLNIVTKDKLLVSITQSVSDIFSLYEASVGTIEGCKELINNIVGAKDRIDIQMKDG
tara:strand:+ start:432 stop:749 length:318 start_codon:yes stop_codon:yes gene_type:complete